MSAASRRKGLAGEREVADRFIAAGFDVRGLESSGDWLAIGRDATLHLEVKRQERLQLPAWLAQAKQEAPQGVPPIVVFRQNRGEWYACLPLEDLLRLLW